MKSEYVHLPLGEDIHFLAGYYTPLKEFNLTFNGRTILCVTGASCVESGCCGGRSGTYAIVPGYIMNWQYRKNDRGLPVTEVEPVTDEAVKREIRAMVKANETVWTIDFW